MSRVVNQKKKVTGEGTKRRNWYENEVDKETK